MEGILNFIVDWAARSKLGPTTILFYHLKMVLVILYKCKVKVLAKVLQIFCLAHSQSYLVVKSDSLNAVLWVSVPSRFLGDTTSSSVRSWPFHFC